MVWLFTERRDDLRRGHRAPFLRRVLDGRGGRRRGGSRGRGHDGARGQHIVRALGKFAASVPAAWRASGALLPARSNNKAQGYCAGAPNKVRPALRALGRRCQRRGRGHPCRADRLPVMRRRGARRELVDGERDARMGIGSGTARTLASAAMAEVAVSKRCSGSRAEALANHASNPERQFLVLPAARALARSTGPFAAIAAKAKTLPSPREVLVPVLDANEERVSEHAERVDVGRGPPPHGPEELLGRHVERRADAARHVPERRGTGDELRDAEIEHLDARRRRRSRSQRKRFSGLRSRCTIDARCVLSSARAAGEGT